MVLLFKSDDTLCQMTKHRRLNHVVIEDFILTAKGIGSHKSTQIFYNIPACPNMIVAYNFKSYVAAANEKTKFEDAFSKSVNGK